LPLRQLLLPQLSLHYVWSGLFPATYNSKKGGGGGTFEITNAAPPVIMSETRFSSDSWTDPTSVVLSWLFWCLLLENGECKKDRITQSTIHKIRIM